MEKINLKLEMLRPFLDELVGEMLEKDGDPWVIIKSILSQKLGDQINDTPPLKPRKMLGYATLPDAAESELWKSHPAVRNIVFVVGASDSICYEQSALLSVDLKFVHIDVKDIVQKFLTSYSSGSLASAMVKIVQGGGELPLEITLYLLKESLKKELESNPKGFLIQGFPNSLEEAIQFEKQIQTVCYSVCFDVDFDNLKNALEYPNEDDVHVLKVKLQDFQDSVESFVSYFKKLNKISLIPAEGNAQAIFQVVKQQLVENVNFLGEAIILIGGPASGKGTISELMLNHHVSCHISTGDLLRHEINTESFIGLLLKETISHGDLVPDDIIMNLLIGKVADSKRFPILILDGFPRTVEQAKLLSNYLNISQVIYFKCEKETLVKRIVNRGKTSGRADDNEETAQNRITTFFSETLPVLDYYNQRDLVVEINAEESVEEVWAAVQNVLK